MGQGFVVSCLDELASSVHDDSEPRQSTETIPSTRSWVQHVPMPRFETSGWLWNEL